MPIEIFDYINVNERAARLGCNLPTELALLPRNFETAESKEELIHESSVPDIRILWRQAGLTETRIEQEGDRFLHAQENAFEWLGPTIFVGTMLASQNPHAVSVALNILSNYLT